MASIQDPFDIIIEHLLDLDNKLDSIIEKASILTEKGNKKNDEQD